MAGEEDSNKMSVEMSSLYHYHSRQDPLGNGRVQSRDGIGEGDLGVGHCRRLLLTALPKPENDRETIKAATTQCKREREGQHVSNLKSSGWLKLIISILSVTISSAQSIVGQNSMHDLKVKFPFFNA